MKINLFINLYHIEDTDRYNEVFECMSKNVLNPLIDRIICLDEGFNWEGIYPSKCKIVTVNSRLTFADYQQYFKNDEINIIANNDILFDATLKKIRSLFVLRNTCLALTRHESEFELFREEFGDSQDVWVFYGKPHFLTSCNFFLGVPGCDNKIAFAAWNRNYVIINPSKSIRCYHMHKGEQRKYTESDRVSNPYLLLTPISIKRAVLVIIYSFLIMRFARIKLIRKDQRII